MKNLFNITIAVVAGFSLFGCANLNKPSNVSTSIYKSVMKLHVRDACNVEKNGVTKVLELAEKYNPIAVKDGVEFMRFGVTTSEYIHATKKAIKNGSKNAHLVTIKGKSGGTMPIAFTAWRSCAFAISALKQEQSVKKTWKLAVPGEGFKY